MNTTIAEQRTEAETKVEVEAEQAAGGLGDVKPLPVWFFAFEGAMGAAYDLIKAWENAWIVVAALGVVNIVVGLTVMRGRLKLVKAMMKTSRTRWIMLAVVALRLALHGVLAVAGAQVTSAAGHLALGVGMGAATVTLLWFDQRVTFRALGLTPAPTRTA